MLVSIRQAWKNRKGRTPNSAVLLRGAPDPELFKRLRKSGIRDVVLMEGRPNIKTAKNTCRALIRERMEPIVITDNMAGFVIQQGLVREIWITYQDGDKKGALCDVGALILGVLGKRHGIPVYLYPSEERIGVMAGGRSVLYFERFRIAPKNTATYVPRLEWVPGKYITEIYD